MQPKVIDNLILLNEKFHKSYNLKIPQNLLLKTPHPSPHLKNYKKLKAAQSTSGLFFGGKKYETFEDDFSGEENPHGVVMVRLRKV